MQREMTGGTLLATRLARAWGGVAVNLGGGFHHARRDRGAGFCILNDVAVAIRAQRAQGFDRRILVSIWISTTATARARSSPTTRRCTPTRSTTRTGTTGRRSRRRCWRSVRESTTRATLRPSPSALPALFDRFLPELVIYLCGADPASDDALGDWQVSAAGMLARDRAVTDLVRHRRLPLVVTMAGGYGDNSWRYTARYLSWLASGRVLEPPTTEELILDRFRDLVHDFSLGELRGTAEEEPLLTEADLGGGLGLASPETRLLGFYSLSGLELALERLGHLARLRDLGYENPQVELDLGASGQTLRIFGARGRRELVLEMRLRRDRRTIPGEELLAVDWLLLQNPRGRFSPARPALPGQKLPGLGMLRETMAAVVLICERLHLSGIIVTPSHFHAVVQARSQMRFLDPRSEGLFRVFQKALAPLSLGEATRAASNGQLRDAATGEPVYWTPSPMVLPVSAALRQRLESPDYERDAAQCRERRERNPARATLGSQRGTVRGVRWSCGSWDGGSGSMRRRTG